VGGLFGEDKDDKSEVEPATGGEESEDYSSTISHYYTIKCCIVDGQKEIWVEDIHGILYYLDEQKNVYHTEDVEKKVVNPSIIATWSKVGNEFTIHWK